MGSEQAREAIRNSVIYYADNAGAFPENDAVVSVAEAIHVATTAREQALREAAEKIRVLVEEVSEAGIQASQRGDFTASSREGAKVSALIRAKDRILSLLTKEPKA